MTKTKSTKSGTGSNGMAAMRVMENYVIGAHDYRVLPLSSLFVDDTYQRDGKSAARAQKIARAFDENLFEALVVNERDPQKFSVIDGQGRLGAAKILGHETITCRVIHVDHETEAWLFVKYNRERAYLTPVQSFKAELVAKDPAAMEIDRCLQARDLTTGGSKQALASTVAAVTSMKTIYARAGSVGLSRVLDAAILAWNESVPGRFEGRVLLGMDIFLADNPRVDLTLLGEKLSRTTPRTLQAKASQRWHAWKALGEAGGLSDALAEEIATAYRKKRASA